jgi:hypothetical protein
MTIATSYRNQCIVYAADGLRDGLTHYSGLSRVALIYAVRPEDPMRIYDPQSLLRGHEPKLRELYLESCIWREKVPALPDFKQFRELYTEKNLELAGLISFGGRSRSLFYQMWFTEHHPDMCSIGPTERWLEHTAWLLSNDFTSETTVCTETSGYVLRGYATHAVRDYILDQMNVMLGWDTQVRVYPILDAVLGVSQSREEGAWPRGELVCVDPSDLEGIEFIARFPAAESPRLENHKHVRKLLQSVENSDRKLISDGNTIFGIARGALPACRITADFHGRHGFIRLNGDLVCSFSDGSFHSKTHRAKMVQLEESLLESIIDSDSVHDVFKMIARIVHYAETQKYGCTIVLDLNDPPIGIPGQHLAVPVDLREEIYQHLAESLARVDGALHIGADQRLYAFACLLDGRSVPSEDRARGARFNSALRFTATNPNVIVIVVSADHPVSVIQEGIAINAQCAWNPLSSYHIDPPTLQEWINGADS